MTATAEDEASGRGVEHELEYIAGLVAYLQAPAVVVHGHDGASLDATAEVRDSSRRADAR
jgi:hypothetical protein